MINGTARVICKCVHEQQDKMYGHGNRIANTTPKQDKDYVTVRCTVCGTTQRINPSKVRS